MGKPAIDYRCISIASSTKFSPMPRGSIGFDGGIGFGIDGIPSDSEEAFGVRCYLFGVTVFAGLFLLDTAVLIRIRDGVAHKTGFDPVYELHHFFYGGMVRWTEMLANVAVFVPFGFFLSEFLSMTKRLAPRRQIRLVALATSGLSLYIETLQLVIRLGVFELTDLVLNTLGGVIGAGIAWRFRVKPGMRKGEPGMRNGSRNNEITNH